MIDDALERIINRIKDAKNRMNVSRKFLEESEFSYNLALADRIMFLVDRQKNEPKSKRDIFLNAVELGAVWQMNCKNLLKHKMRHNSQDKFCKTSIWATCDGVRLRYLRRS